MSICSDNINAAARFIESRAKSSPKIGVILGSGLGDVVEAMESSVSIPFSEVPHFPSAAAPSHKGLIHCGKLAGVEVLIMQGRVHTYEGYSSADVAFPVRVMKALGVESLITTNAAGGINQPSRLNRDN